MQFRKQWIRRVLMTVPLSIVALLVVTSCSGGSDATPTPRRQATATSPAAQPTPVPTATPTVAATRTPQIDGFKSPEELTPAGLAEAHPLIAQYHWSKLAPPQKGPPNRGGTLRLNISFEPNNWDPIQGNFGTLIYGNLLYNNLVRADMRLSEALRGKDNLRSLIVACDLCQSYEIVSPSVYRFTLRSDARWHATAPLNGRSITANDVKSAYTRYMTPDAFRQYGQFSIVESIQAPDARTVVINLKQQSSGFLEAITAPAFFVLPDEAFTRQGGPGVTPPLGSGSFLLDRHDQGTRVAFNRNPQYFKTDEYGIQLPYLDRIEITAMAAAAQLAAWRTNQIDQINALSQTTLANILRDERVPQTANLRVEEANTSGGSLFQFQLRSAPFNDVRVRRALSAAVDRKSMIKLAHQEGYCQPQPIPTWWQGFNFPPACGGVPWTQYNPQLARTLLQEAGYGPNNPLQFTLHGSGTGGQIDPRFVAMFEIAQQNWNDVGVRTNIVIRERTLHENLLRSGTYEGIIGGTGVGGGNDLDSFAQKFRSDSPENFSGIGDPVLNRLIDDQRRTVGTSERRRLATEISGRLADQVWILTMTSGYFAEYTRPYVQNWATHALYMWVHGFGAHAMENVWFLPNR